MFHRRPIALGQLKPETSLSLARLSATEGFSRSILVSVVPLVALEALGTKEMVSLAYLSGAVLTLCITLNTAFLERLIQRRWVVTLAAFFLMLAALFLYLKIGPLFAMGIGLRSAAASLFSVCLSLYIMDYIGRRDLARSESRRTQHLGVTWLVGPLLGTWIVQQGNYGYAYAVSATAALLTLVYFWHLRLGDNLVVRKATSHAKNPLNAVGRYMSQQKLRIAYGITISRSCFWVALFVYGPIYVIDAGLSPWVAGFLLSGVSALLFFSPLVRKLADKIGTRQVIIVCLLLTGSSLVCLGLLQSAKPIGLVFWVLGAVGGAGLDVLGNIPFMRSVKPRERSEMTMVFSTWREGSELLTPAIVFLTLLVAPFWAFYFVIATLHFLSAYKASFLPKRL